VSPPPVESDGELASRAATGDERAFTLLMRKHKEGLYRLVRRYVGDADEAYDLLQESFAAAWRGLDRYDPARPFEVWLRRVALNKCRDWSRRRFVRRLVRGVGAESAELEAAPDPGASPEAALVDAEALRRLDRAVADLPPALKEPLILTALEGLSQQEAAALLGVSVKAVETRVYRARRRLAEITGATLGEREG
jgi:RNA polymerase sigma-70 factor (ECF subfamily)